MKLGYFYSSQCDIAKSQLMPFTQQAASYKQENCNVVPSSVVQSKSQRYTEKWSSTMVALQKLQLCPVSVAAASIAMIPGVKQHH